MNFNMSKTTLGILAIIAGILCIFWPSLLQWVVGIFLIVWGILTLIGKKD